ncbi:nicotinate-nucleotide--dimethylbenzimidazole phosphoribosyltransferase [Stappia taiwanensis]|uniref:Nicotinate-nucleotide--dimethylbenzimidazole phosphoribosyltransferase n=1 Tax=Stappia taiwanensis TaxID=992267 RepID=A0A838XTB1_9HYPH|nr:nicotinate-nucleotide--dimethylbenzimidazole phosphoribosyltransferase [Stappia taiwanensis]MBA4610130.1 nicotinate-nucleotide--dimethylbenzimidazole phosphoribosyltransferase [Stappia taiwanensis]GGE77139.1 nicotinate-nucleotide--dimethylbenzimidazole phosphoribosyltransferase [Stappia taiwanensis]
MSLSASALPFDDIRNLVRQMPGPDEEARQEARARDAQLTKPAGSLGRLEELAEWVAGWSGQGRPKITRPLVAIFAANHGVAAKGVSAFPASVTRQMVENFAAGGAAINQLCIAHDLGLKVFDLALDMPTPDITEDDAFDEANCAATMAFGMEAVAGGTDLLCLGEMGIANTTVAAAVFAALFGGAPGDWVGPGTGVDADGMARKRAAVEAAVARIGGERDPLEILRRVGGREIAAMAGAVLAARLQRIPVIVDGFVTTAAAAVLYAMDPEALDHCLFAHVSAEPAHRRALETMGKTPLLDMGMRLGEGTGAALAAGIVKAATQVHDGMATFADAGVADKDG